jgi:PelA/Pel-15E family pectate lyase
MKILSFSLLHFFCYWLFIGCKTDISKTSPLSTEVKKDSVAERMLLYQRNNGGWPQPGGDPINYDKSLSETLINKLLKEKDKLDATIDDAATTKEIKTLVTAYKKTQNKAYLIAAEKGIDYLLKAQNKAGGWGQFYPDTSGYHKHITYNDNAMINVMWIMKYTIEGKNDFDVVNKTLIPQAKIAMEKGIVCILKTQYKQNGKLTAWCAQHDRVTLMPAKARAFELPSLSGSESVGILEFLMKIENPSPEIKNAVNAGVAWLEAVKLQGIATKVVTDASLPRGKDIIVVEDPASTLWARFYDLDTNKPFFCGRDGIKKNTLAEIENERRAGYGWYGKWPASLLAETYPKWIRKWGK